MKRRRIWVVCGGLAVLAAAGAWLLLRAPLADALELHRVPLVRTAQFSARVATLSRVDLGSTLTARVEQVLVREGAAVREGELLVRLESDEARAALAQAGAAQRQAEARLAGLRTTGRSLTQAALAQAEATVTAARAEMERAQRLVAQGFVSASRLDETRRALDVALAQQDSARAQAQANADAGSEVVQAEAQLAVARAATAAARARLEQTELRAPAAGKVLARAVEPGQIVQPGRALLSLALAGPTQLVAQVDERFLDQLQTGQQASVMADAFAGRRFAAQVSSISPLVDAQRGAVEVKLALGQQPPAFLREDMTLSVEVETARRERALALPLSALRTQSADDAAQVLVLADGRARPREIRLGLRTLQAVEVLEGLAEGDAVLLGSTVKAGERVRARVVTAWSDSSPATGNAKGGGAGAALTNAMGR